MLLTVGGFIGAAVHGNHDRGRVMFVPGYRNGPVNGPFGPNGQVIPRYRLPRPGSTVTPSPSKT